MGYTRMPIPSDLVVPMCFCGDPCMLQRSEEMDDTYGRRYFMCANWAFDPPPQAMMRGVLEPPPLCDFEQWVDLEQKEEHRKFVAGMKEFNEEIKEAIAKRKREEAFRTQRIEEEKMRQAAKRKEERQRKLERVRRAKAALQDNPDALRKGKWPRCTQ